MALVHERGNAVLEGVRDDTDALVAVVRDESSPVTWWSAGPAGAPWAEALIRELLQEASRSLAGKSLRSGAQLRLCREQDPPHGLVHSFAGIYMLVVGFEAPFNRFQVEPHARRALPILEQLVPQLPPHDDDRGQRGDARSRIRALPKKRD